MIALSPTRRVDTFRHGFTVYEFATVAALLLGLAGMAGVSVVDYLADAKIEQARNDCRILSDSCQHYVNTHPDTPLSDLAALRDMEPKLCPKTPPVIDPWGKPYQLDYNTETASYRISTIAPDGTEISN